VVWASRRLHEDETQRCEIIRGESVRIRKGVREIRFRRNPVKLENLYFGGSYR